MPHYSLSTTQNRLEELRIANQSIDEGFFVRAIVYYISYWLESLSEDYGKNIDAARRSRPTLRIGFKKRKWRILHWKKFTSIVSI